MSKEFSTPPDPHRFNFNVWELVTRIPPGKVATYGQIARLVASPSDLSNKKYLAFAARWVGGAMVACPSGVPWQRVVNSQGKISLSGSSRESQRLLLEAEGVVFDELGRINLDLFLWAGPS